MPVPRRSACSNLVRSENHAVPDRIDGQADDVIGGRLEDAVRALFLQSRVADARRGKRDGPKPEVRVQRAAQHTECLGVRSGGTTADGALS